MGQMNDYASWTEERLLAAFVQAHDEAALACLVQRYGSMVWLCHNVLGQTQDAEDATQAVFLVLARKAGGLRTNRPLGPWLHHVAEARSSLNLPDQEAVLLRIVNRKSLREVEQILGVSDDAAQKRVTRALEKLRDFLRMLPLGLPEQEFAALHQVGF